MNFSALKAQAIFHQFDQFLAGSDALRLSVLLPNTFTPVQRVHIVQVAPRPSDGVICMNQYPLNEPIPDGVFFECGCLSISKVPDEMLKIVSRYVRPITRVIFCEDFTPACLLFLHHELKHVFLPSQIAPSCLVSLSEFVKRLPNLETLILPVQMFSESEPWHSVLVNWIAERGARLKELQLYLHGPDAIKSFDQNIKGLGQTFLADVFKVNIIQESVAPTKQELELDTRLPASFRKSVCTFGYGRRVRYIQHAPVTTKEGLKRKYIDEQLDLIF